MHSSSDNSRLGSIYIIRFQLFFQRNKLPNISLCFHFARKLTDSAIHFLYDWSQPERELNIYRYIFYIFSVFYEYTYGLFYVSTLQSASLVYEESSETLRGTTRDSTRVAPRLYGKDKTPLKNRTFELDATKSRPPC